MKSNLVIVGLLERFVKKVSKEISDRLGMFFASAKDLVSYQLLDPNEMVMKCGIDYMIDQEKKTIEDLCEYENTVVAIDFNLFVSNDSWKKFKKSAIIIFIKIDDDQLLKIHKLTRPEHRGDIVSSLIDFQDRTKELEEISDIVVYDDDLDTKIYVEKLMKLLKKGDKIQ